MGNKFCKVKDNNTTYVLLDKDGQPLNCPKTDGKNNCVIFDYQKVLDSPDKYNQLSEKDVITTTNIQCSFNDGAYVTNNSDVNQYDKAEVFNKDGKKQDMNSKEFTDFETQYASSLMGINQSKTADGYVDKTKIQAFQDTNKQVFKVQNSKTQEDDDRHNHVATNTSKNIIEKNDSLQIILIILFVLLFLIVLIAIIYLVYVIFVFNNRSSLNTQGTQVRI